MLTRILFLLCLASSSIILLTGAWTGSFTSLPPAAECDFVPQAITLEADIIGSGIDAKELLRKAVEKLDPKRTPWLNTKIRQTMTDGGSNFVAEGYLQRGPDHCARLELHIGKEGRMLTVSDGTMVAIERRTPGEKPVVEVTRLPEGDAPARESFLHKHACGGPEALLAQFEKQLQNATLQTGRLQNLPVILIKGDLTLDVNKARHARIYLDAQTLWPHRLESYGAGNHGSLRQCLRIEFLAPTLNHELSADECARLFSYDPERE